MQAMQTAQEHLREISEARSVVKTVADQLCHDFELWETTQAILINGILYSLKPGAGLIRHLEYISYETGQ